MAAKMSMTMPAYPAPLCSSSPSPRRCHHQMFHCPGRYSSLHQKWGIGRSAVPRLMPFSSTSLMNSKTRRTLICAVNQDAEEAFKKTVEVDRLIDMLRDANPKEEKIDSATDILKGILKPAVDEVEEITWPPRDPEALKQMERVGSIRREQEGQLDEGFLAEVNALRRHGQTLVHVITLILHFSKQLQEQSSQPLPRFCFEIFMYKKIISYLQAKEDGDKPGFVAMLQKVLQLYASKVLSKRSYAKKGEEVLRAEEFLETMIKAPEQEWNMLLINGMTVGKGEISPDDFYAVIKKRIERTLIRTEGGSYQQRILTEYLKGIESRAQEIVQVLQGKPQ
ncbi:hypothetical protein FNV43_RR22861 [Rhamnella rubrinervis]|uniref:Uncharacterized protein n=1 Tax=Rhamnella rubrinervis TaxID=2594499 RepID=A0A8K0DXE7_9ROSA|nr:hypothetical protein FNV43_RR22861 [Rhamnella rubrinervis]